MPDSCSIIDIQRDWRRGVEDMGSKRKFWFRMDEEDWLFKEARPNTGEHWAEKIASEIAGELLGLDTHTVRLARYQGTRGCAVKSFLQEGDSLIHGNEVLSGMVDNYDKDKKRQQSDHTLDNIAKGLSRWFAEKNEVHPIFQEFVGYLVLDALVGNTDRHHENWGLLVGPGEISEPTAEKALEISFNMSLAPTFDHGSSLGRELLDERIALFHRDQGAMDSYFRKGFGGIYARSGDRRALTPCQVVGLVSHEYPEAWAP